MALTTVQGQMLTAPLTLTGNLTFSDGSVQAAAASPYVLKNRIINGAMQIWQRGTSVSGTYVYGTDRWATLPFATCNIAQSTSVPTTTGSSFQYSAKVGRTASSTATTAIGIMQTIESVNCYDLSGQTVTLSFWAKAGANFSAASNNIGVQFITGTTADQGGSIYYTWAGQNNVINTSQSITTTWTKYTFTGTCGSGVLEGALLIYFTPVGTAGADDNFYITGVQLEIGSTATPFERRLYNQELANCQRYFEMTYDIGTAPGNVTYIGAWYSSFNGGLTTTYVGGLISYKVTKRAVPTLSTWDVSGNSGKITREALGVAQYANNTVTVSNPGTNYCIAFSASGSSCQAASAQWTASAEL